METLFQTTPHSYNLQALGTSSTVVCLQWVTLACLSSLLSRFEFGLSERYAPTVPPQPGPDLGPRIEGLFGCGLCDGLYIALQTGRLWIGTIVAPDPDPF